MASFVRAHLQMPPTPAKGLLLICKVSARPGRTTRAPKKWPSCTHVGHCFSPVLPQRVGLIIAVHLSRTNVSKSGLWEMTTSVMQQKGASQRLPPNIKGEIPLYHRSGEKPLDPTTLVKIEMAFRNGRCSSWFLKNQKGTLQNTKPSWPVAKNGVRAVPERKCFTKSLSVQSKSRK